MLRCTAFSGSFTTPSAGKQSLVNKGKVSEDRSIKEDIVLKDKHSNIKETLGSGNRVC